jgi:hypothetical protein
LIRVDPAVCRIKYERELKRLAEQRAALETRGIFVVGPSEFPIVECVLVPRYPMRLAIPAPAPSTIILPPGATAFQAVEIPSIATRAFKARFDLTDYDLRAPSLEFRDPWTDDLLIYATMLRAIEYERDRQAHLVLLDDHPVTHKPFLCLRGVREYHEHPQHSGDSWLLYRTEMSLFSIIMALWRVTIDLTRPTVVPQPSGIVVQWDAEAKA